MTNELTLVINDIAVRRDVIEELSWKWLLPDRHHEPWLATIEKKLGFSAKAGWLALLTETEFARRGLDQRDISLICRVLLVLNMETTNFGKPADFVTADGWTDADQKTLNQKLFGLAIVWNQIDVLDREQLRASHLAEKISAGLNRELVAVSEGLIVKIVSGRKGKSAKSGGAKRVESERLVALPTTPWQATMIKALASGAYRSEAQVMLEAMHQIAKTLPPESISPHSAEKLAALICGRLEISLRTYYRRVRDFPAVKQAHRLLAPGAAERLKQTLDLLERREISANQPMTIASILKLAGTDGAKLYRRDQGKHRQPKLIERARALVEESQKVMALRPSVEPPRDRKLKAKIERLLALPAGEPPECFLQRKAIKPIGIKPGSIGTCCRRNAQIAVLFNDLKCRRAMAWYRRRGAALTPAMIARAASLPLDLVERRLAENPHLSRAFASISNSHRT